MCQRYCAETGQETKNDPSATLDPKNDRNRKRRQNADAMDDGPAGSTDSGHKGTDSDNIAPETRLTFRKAQQSRVGLSDYPKRSL